MPFIDKKGAMKLLKEIENGKCAGECRSIWKSQKRAII